MRSMVPPKASEIIKLSGIIEMFLFNPLLPDLPIFYRGVILIVQSPSERISIISTPFSNMTVPE
jgi:hypothetical protein